MVPLRRLAWMCRELAKQHVKHPDVPAAPDGAVYLAGDYTRDSSINGALVNGRDAAVAVDADAA